MEAVKTEGGLLADTETSSWPLAPVKPDSVSLPSIQAEVVPRQEEGGKQPDSLRTSVAAKSEASPTPSDYTLSNAKYSPPKRSSKPAITIPAPHLPLRKRASQNLRLRTSTSSTGQHASAQQTMGQMVQSLRPETTRWSRDSSRSQPLHPSTPMASAEPRSAISQRPRTAQDMSEEIEADTLSPLQRPMTSVSDYTSARNPHRNTANSDTMPDKGSPKRTSAATSPRSQAPFWRDGTSSSLRESVLSSTHTDASSIANTSSTSVWTARSSRTTYSSPMTDSMKISDDELSVDDCIAMYADGFKDDVTEDSRRASFRMSSTTPPVPAIPREEDRTTSTTSSIQRSRIPSGSSQPSETMPKATSTRSSDTLTRHSKSLSLPLSQSTSQRRSSRAPRDFYGFKKESQHVTVNRYTAWHWGYKIHLERRKKKWVYLMNSSGLPSKHFPDKFPPRSEEVKRYIRKGIPPAWRGAAWFFYGNGADFLEANDGLYDHLVQKLNNGGLPEVYRDMIERDLNRTFPDNEYFKPDHPPTSSEDGTPQETDMIKSLRRILQAFAIHHPKVGYCQSLNFLAGLLLLFMRLSFQEGNYEERAFAMLCILTDKYLPGTHGVILEGCNVDIGVLMTILQETMPSIWERLDNNSRDSIGSRGRKGSRASVTLRAGTEDLPTVSLATTAWFMSCFVGTLPIESVCRVWDCLWYEGSKTIFRVALAIFKLGEKQIRKCNDPTEVFQIVQTLPKGLLDANELMQVATMKSGRVGTKLGQGTPGFGGLSQKTVENRRQERRAFGKGTRDGPDYEGQDDMSYFPPPVPDLPDDMPPGGGLKRSKTRGTLKRLKSIKKIG